MQPLSLCSGKRRPGKTLCLLWHQGRSERPRSLGFAECTGEFELGRDAERLFQIEPENMFMITVH